MTIRTTLTILSAATLCGAFWACSSSEESTPPPNPGGSGGSTNTGAGGSGGSGAAAGQGGTAGSGGIVGGGGAGGSGGAVGGSGGGVAGSGGVAGGGGDLGGGGAGGGACQPTLETADVVPVDMLLLVDRSGSMTGTNWDAVVAALSQFFNSPGSSSIHAAINYFPPPGAVDECAGSSYSPPHVPFAALPADGSVLIADLGSQSPSGTTPTYGVLLGSLQYATAYQDLHLDHEVITVMATDGDPTTCDTSIPSIAALAASAYNYNGVRTFGIAIQGATVTNVQQIAQAGGGEAVDVGVDISLFVQTLQSFSAQARACGYVIPDPGGPLDPALVNVVYTPGGGSPNMLPQAAQQAACGADPGWFYDNPNDPARVHLCPASCVVVEQDPNATIEVAFGCPTVVQ